MSFIMDYWTFQLAAIPGGCSFFTGIPSAKVLNSPVPGMYAAKKQNTCWSR
jgi:hypothetical protein